ARCVPGRPRAPGEPRAPARAPAGAAARLGLALPRPSFADVASVPPSSCDHLWMVSVLTDPDVFPALHDELYGRRGSALATHRGSAPDERLRAEDFRRAFL